MPTLTLNTSTTIQTGITLYYQLIEGDKNKPYLVFLHEGLGCEALWKGYPQLLCEATGCRGLVYDRQGYGQSDALNQQRTVHYMHDYALNELPEVLQKAIPDTPYILVGHSDGGSIALIYGAQRPTLLRGIITEAAHVFVEDETIDGIAVADSAWEKGKLAGLAKYHGDKTQTTFKAWSQTWMTTWFKHWNIEYLLPSINAPLLVIQGKDDQYGSVAQVDAIVAKSTGPAQARMVDNCGHAPHLEAQEIVLGLMVDFVTQRTATS